MLNKTEYFYSMHALFARKNPAKQFTTFVGEQYVLLHRQLVSASKNNIFYGAYAYLRT